MPSFIKAPDDQTGISGGVASFVCQAVGEPKPRITWMKKGKKVSSQRFEVQLESWPQSSLSYVLECVSTFLSSLYLSKRETEQHRICAVILDLQLHCLNIPSQVDVCAAVRLSCRVG